MAHVACRTAPLCRRSTHAQAFKSCKRPLARLVGTRFFKEKMDALCFVAGSRSRRDVVAPPTSTFQRASAVQLRGTSLVAIACMRMRVSIQTLVRCASDINDCVSSWHSSPCLELSNGTALTHRVVTPTISRRANNNNNNNKAQLCRDAHNTTKSTSSKHRASNNNSSNATLPRLMIHSFHSVRRPKATTTTTTTTVTVTVTATTNERTNEQNENENERSQQQQTK